MCKYFDIFRTLFCYFEMYNNFPRLKFLEERKISNYKISREILVPFAQETLPESP